MSTFMAEAFTILGLCLSVVIFLTSQYDTNNSENTINNETQETEKLFIFKTIDGKDPLQEWIKNNQ